MTELAFVRSEQAPKLPPPRALIGVEGWLRANLFYSITSTVITAAATLFIITVLWSILDWAIFRAVWSGSNREPCAVEGAGACWPFVWAKYPQWIYGFYPIDQRWRPNLVFFLAAAGLIPMLMPSVRHKLWNGLFLLVAFPLITIILLSGGNVGFSPMTYGIVAGLLLIGASFLPLAAFGLESGVRRNRNGLGLVLAGVLPLLLAFALLILAALSSFFGTLLSLASAEAIAHGFYSLTGLFNSLRQLIFAIPWLLPLMGLLVLGGAGLSVRSAWNAGTSAITGWVIAAGAIFVAMFLLDVDFGLIPVETSDWGGLLVTLVVSVTGIVASLPLGILLALGRRSNMPVVKTFSVVFIETWRGVPLITVLFMSSVMLPLFLPPGTNFDKLLRMLIGIALFSSAYMAEVVRGGLQSVPRGQYEAAQALGLSYWQLMAKIILPQALKVSIPNIVGSFISLFKDTTLVSIVGIYDLLGIIIAGYADADWASPQTSNTGYFTATLIFWVFCFAMSRYAVYTERRLNTGHKR